MLGFRAARYGLDFGLIELYRGMKLHDLSAQGSNLILASLLMPLLGFLRISSSNRTTIKDRLDHTLVF